MNVYIIEHIPSGRVYVGKANDVKKRWHRHIRNSKEGRGSYIHAAIRKYGVDEFRIKNVFSFGSESDAYKAEEMCVRFLRADKKGIGFNITSGGLGGRSVSAATREKMSKSALGRKHSIETRKKISEALSVRITTAETREKRRISATGRVASKETREKIGAANRIRFSKIRSDASDRKAAIVKWH